MKARKIKLTFLVLLAFTFIMASPPIKSSALTSPPLYLNSTYPGWYENPSNDYLLSYAGDAGYTVSSRTYKQAYETLYDIPNDAVFYIKTHGYGEDDYREGVLACYVDDPNISRNFSTLSAYNSTANPLSANANLSDIYGSNSSALSTVRLAYFAACCSAYNSIYYGCLPAKCTALGAKCSIGWSKSIGQLQSDDFDRHFFSYTMESSYSIQDSARWASADAISNNGGIAANIDTYVIYYRGGTTASPGSIYLRPAKYGNQ